MLVAITLRPTELVSEKAEEEAWSPKSVVMPNSGCCQAMGVEEEDKVKDLVGTYSWVREGKSLKVKSWAKAWGLWAK